MQKEYPARAFVLQKLQNGLKPELDTGQFKYFDNMTSILKNCVNTVKSTQTEQKRKAEKRTTGEKALKEKNTILD